MPAEREAIELDEYDHQPAESGGATPDRLMARRKMNVRLVAAFVVGVVLGGVGISELRDARDERKRNASVLLVVFAASGDGGSDVHRPAPGEPVTGVVQMNGQLRVLNAGPAPITVRAAVGERPGIQVRDTGQSRLLSPSGTGRIDVTLRIECSNAFGSEPLPIRAFGSEPLSIRFSVETADRQVREVSYPVDVMGSAWHQGAELPCRYLSDVAKRGG
ncbi:hypothetical protein AB0C02_22130 [Micromonospora sp. NPDC048999]|uniref:hypothetical protein n=1 Tax=Micromonospora sp. NPDC048999 TaxID=3155391 RepID=UPI0033EB6D0C